MSVFNGKLFLQWNSVEIIILTNQLVSLQELNNSGSTIYGSQSTPAVHLVPPESLNFNSPNLSSTSAITNSQLICNFCSRIFFYKSEMDRHLRTHTNERPYHCSLCPYKAKYKGNLKSHVVVNHSS